MGLASRDWAERRRDETRMSIAASAGRLFVERGFDGTTVEDIARDAGISVRTFYRHCDTKEDALTPILTSGVRNFVSDIRDRPEEEPVETSVHAAFVAGFRRNSLADIVPGRDLFVILSSVPGMRNRWMAAALAVTDELRPVIAGRTGLDPNGLEARLLSHTLIGALTVTLEYWASRSAEESSDRVDLVKLAASALSIIRFDRG
ncbi:TetR family transcriptional regulator [Nocardia sp. CA-135398]|uniref:TetR family transcriptional regulator n=1 Tax=Nocardia sp. CA-135398 TaxID=3239977 RepID=UPI003D96621D